MPFRRTNRLITDAMLNALLVKYESETTLTDEGNLSFQHLDFEELELLLSDAWEADSAFTPRQVRSILDRALRDARKEGPLSIEAVTVQAQRLARDQLAKPMQHFTMWTKFRAEQMDFHPGFRLDWNGVQMRSAASLPAFARLDGYELSGHGSVEPREPVFFGYLIATCDARDEESAVGQMLEAQDLFMACFNMYTTGWQWTIGLDRRPEGKLWHGPFHFVFEKKRFLGVQQVWYEPDYDEDVWRTFAPKMGEILKHIPRTRSALKALADSPLRDVLSRVLRLMQSGMASLDPQYRLLRYWSALEQLYGDPNGRDKNYPRIIQRATFADGDKIIERWKLGHISRQRNEYVHAGGGSDDLATMTQYLRMKLARHVNHLLFHAPEVTSHAHWLEIVDLPDAEHLLEERKKVIDQRLEFIRNRKREKSA
jgi:hypothetical protein